jgi:hypothetical protein
MLHLLEYDLLGFRNMPLSSRRCFQTIFAQHRTTSRTRQFKVRALGCLPRFDINRTRMDRIVLPISVGG